MFSFVGTVIDAIAWIVATDWKVWSGLFAWLPYGDPYIAIVATLMVCYVAHRIINPDKQWHN